MKEKQSEVKSWQFVKWIFKVLYSPFKTFEEVVKDPTVKGPILILVIMLPLLVGAQYIGGTKFFFEKPLPENDLWTENSSNTALFLWSADSNITFDNKDYIIGDYSVSSSLVNASFIWMQLTDIGSFNCSEEEYDNLSFRLKWINSANAAPASAVLQLFSFNNETRRFELDMASLVANSTGAWANVSVNLATNSWSKLGSLPSWANITGIGFKLTWVNPANLTLKIDDLFFGKYVSASSYEGSTTQLVYSFMRSGVSFVLEWLILSGIVLLALKSFSDWKGIWKSLFPVVGYVYSTYIAFSVVLILLYLVLPPFFLPYNITLEVLNNYQSSWGMPITMLNLISYAWTAFLCVIAVRKIHSVSWNKAFLIGMGAVLLSIILSGILLSMLPF